MKYLKDIKIDCQYELSYNNIKMVILPAINRLHEVFADEEDSRYWITFADTKNHYFKLGGVKLDDVHDILAKQNSTSVRKNKLYHVCQIHLRIKGTRRTYGI